MSDPSNTRPGPASLPDQGGDALPAGARLAEFEIREVLGAGGFGIVYRAWDEALLRDVALKEYMPVSLAGRGAGERVTLRSQMHEENFAFGLQSFVNEARLLARFDQPALVKVLRFWEANGTAYMAMPLYQGRTLRQLRKDAAPTRFDDAWLRALIGPLLDALEVMHEAAVFHRDIAPDNILWCDDSRPVLLDFGAARLVLADRTQNVTAILKPQFAPIEQYAETQTMRQGPWTDLYALAGTCYFMLTGRAPLPATARMMDDELVPLVRVAPPGCSPRVLQALDWAMAVRPQDRPQSVAQWRDALAGHIAVPPREPARALAAARDPTPETGGYEKTIQVTRHRAAAQRTGTPAAAPSAPVAEHDYPDRPDRSVMLPPRSQSPLKAVLLLLVLGAAVAGAWTTRRDWMPAVGLQAMLPAEPGAPSAAAADSAGTAAPGTAAEAAEAASQPSPAASEAAAVAAARPASEAPAPSPVVVAKTPRAALPTHPASPAEARRKAQAARIAALTLPPPVLPPENESHVGPRAAEPVSSGSHAGSPREICADQEPGKAAACVRQLCETDARYARFPICQRVHRQDEQQAPRGTTE
jgi:serine/threonine protein kinase